MGNIFHRCSKRAFISIVAAITLPLLLVVQTGAQATSSQCVLNGSKTKCTLDGVTYSRGEFGITPGTGFFLEANSGTTADRAAMAAQLQDFENLGVRWIRSSIPWSNIEPTDLGPNNPSVSAYNWNGVDSMVYMLTKYHQGEFAGKFHTIITFENPPKWAAAPSGGIPSVAGCAEKPPFNVSEYANAAAALMSHLRVGQSTLTLQTFHTIELENSPNETTGKPDAQLGNVWTHANPCAYAGLLKAAYPAIHAVRPGLVATDGGATVLTAGIGGVKTAPTGCNAGPNPPEGQLCDQLAADTFVSDLYADGAGGFFDGISNHAYSSPSLPCPLYNPPVGKNKNLAPCTYDPTQAIISKEPYGRSNGWDLMLNIRNIMVANKDTKMTNGKAKRIWISEYGSNTPPPVPDLDPTKVQAAFAKDPKAVTDTYNTEMTDQATMMQQAFIRAAQEEQAGWLGPLSIYTYTDGTRDGHNGYYEGLRYSPGVFSTTLTHGVYLGGTQLPGTNASQTEKPSYVMYQSLTAPFQTTSSSANDGDGF